MTYARKTLSEINLIRGNFGPFIRFQDTKKIKEKKYKEPPYKDLTMNPEKVDEESLNEKCWPGYEKKGMKTMFGKRYPNCVKKKKTRKEEFSDWRSEINIDERKMSEKEKRKEDRLKKKYDKSDDMKKKFIEQYGKKKGLEVYYAYIRKEAMSESHYGSDVNKIPAELDKAVALHKSQAERLRKSPEFKKDAGKTANKIPGQLDKAVAMHTKQAKELRAAGVGEKNCGCGKTPCKTYGKKSVKEDITDDALTIQNWNVDDIKFTEIETVDIIKAKPLKENYSDWKSELIELDEKFSFIKHAFGKNIIKATGADKAMGKFPRLSSKAVNTFIKNRSKIALDTFKDKINKLKFDRFVQSADDLPTKFPRDNKVINIKKELNPNAIFPNKSNVKIKNEIISPDGISNKNPIKKIKKDLKDHYDWRAELDDDVLYRLDKLGEDWQKVNRKDKTDGMSQKAVNAYKRENPGSKLKTAVTGKVKRGSKASKRRKSFCARSDGQRKMHNIDCKKTPNKRICKARRRWKC